MATLRLREAHPHPALGGSRLAGPRTVRPQAEAAKSPQTQADCARRCRNAGRQGREPHPGASCPGRPRTLPRSRVQSRAPESKTPGFKACSHRNTICVILNTFVNLFKLQFLDLKGAAIAALAAPAGRACGAGRERREPPAHGRGTGAALPPAPQPPGTTPCSPGHRAGVRRSAGDVARACPLF